MLIYMSNYALGKLKKLHSSISNRLGCRQKKPQGGVDFTPRPPWLQGLIILSHLLSDTPMHVLVLFQESPTQTSQRETKNLKIDKRTWLSVAKMHLYLTKTPIDKRGVFSQVSFDAEFDSGVKIEILSIFDPPKPLFWPKKTKIRSYFPTFSMSMHVTPFFKAYPLFITLN